MKSIIVFITLTVSIVYGQSDLRVQCNQSSNFWEKVYTRVLLNDQIVEYNYCGFDPSFFITIFDTTCTAWYTFYNFNDGYDLNNQNNDGACRSRPEYHFQFLQNNWNQLVSLDSLINNLPANYSFVIYTPMSFDWNEIYSLYQPLAITLQNNWGDAVLEAQMLVAFGVKGIQNSYEIDTTITDLETSWSAGIDSTILFSTTICPHSTQVVNVDAIIENNLNTFDFNVFPNPTNGNLTISTSNTDELFYSIEDIYGREIISKNKFSKKVELDLSNQATGIYIVIIESESGERVVKRVVKN